MSSATLTPGMRLLLVSGGPAQYAEVIDTSEDLAPGYLRVRLYDDAHRDGTEETIAPTDLALLTDAQWHLARVRGWPPRAPFIVVATRWSVIPGVLEREAHGLLPS